MAPRTCFAVTLRGMKPDNGCFVESAIVFELEGRVQAQGEPDAENMMATALYRDHLLVSR
jgi:hypothetical protein